MRRSPLLAAAALAAALLVPAGASAAPKPDPTSGYGPGGGPRPALPLVFGHRGASGYRPEHTLASYRLAARMGADAIEPDLVPTKDGQLVARHEPAIKGTTDVADHPEFASRRTTKVIDGVTYADDWFTEDFTLAELRTLRAKERIPAVRQENTIYDGRYAIPTFQEVLDVRRELQRELGRRIVVAPETKHPTYFRSLGLDTNPLVVRALRRNGLDRRNAPAVVQSFEVDNLKQLDRQIGTPLVQLLDSANVNVAGDPAKPLYGSLATPDGLRAISRYAEWVGPYFPYVLPSFDVNAPNAPGPTRPATSFVADAHRAGLLVVPYTVRAENQFLPTDLRTGTDPNAFGDIFGFVSKLYATGVDGVFCDQPDICVAARDDR